MDQDIESLRTAIARTRELYATARRDAQRKKAQHPSSADLLYADADPFVGAWIPDGSNADLAETVVFDPCCCSIARSTRGGARWRSSIIIIIARIATSSDCARFTAANCGAGSILLVR